MELDTSKWSGEGAFTQALIDRLREMDGVAFVRVEDAPASRSDADYNFVSNEIYVAFRRRERKKPFRRFGLIPATRRATEPLMTLPALETALAVLPDVGRADYADEGMLQFLRTERVVPPYQTRGYKLVELVRLYEVAGS